MISESNLVMGENKYIILEEEEKLSRPVHPLPDFIDDALKESNLDKFYKSRPAYQKNDYIVWIARAKTEKTLHKRLQQMMDELKDGDKYMKMEYHPKIL